MNKEKTKQALKFIYPIIILLLIIVLIILSTVSKPARIVGSSMEPTLKDGDLITINRLHKTIKQGDIIVYKNNEKKYVVKRVIATGGQKIELKDQKLYVDDKVFNYINNGKIKPEDKLYENKNELDIPEDEFFAIGDNWNNSKDCRTYGPMKTERIIGVMNNQK